MRSHPVPKVDNPDINKLLLSHWHFDIVKGEE